MKTQQRKFVVEIKSARRRSPMSDSIWGNTDLEALVREAKAEAPHLFEGNTAPDASGQDVPVPQEDHTQHSDDKVAENQKASMAASQHVLATQHDTGSASSSIAVSQPNKDRFEPRPKKMSQQRRKENVKRRPSFAKDLLDQRSISPQLGAISDELVALEAENRRLKSLFAQSLHQENFLLLKMLERFGND